MSSLGFMAFHRGSLSHWSEEINSVNDISLEVEIIASDVAFLYAKFDS